VGSQLGTHTDRGGEETVPTSRILTHIQNKNKNTDYGNNDITREIPDDSDAGIGTRRDDCVQDPRGDAKILRQLMIYSIEYSKAADKTLKNCSQYST
jgi:hypothetical protein